jgi:flavodoxin
MKIKKIGIVCFSPTNTTKKICTAVALGMVAKELQVDDVPIQIDKISKSEVYTSLKPAHNEKQCIQKKERAVNNNWLRSSWDWKVEMPLSGHN